MIYHRFFAVVSALFLILLAFVALKASPTRTDILILSPHPDDAVLCCAGIIQQAVKNGQTVHVVNLTDGDGYATAAARLAKKPESELTPDDFIRFGDVRREEEIRAMRILGVPHRDVTFLGYPDYWLPEVYEATATPFINPFTKRSHTPAGLPYTKSSLIADIQSILSKRNPSMIYVPGLDDTATDHQITHHALLDATQDTYPPIQVRRYVIHSEEKIRDVMKVFLTDKERETKRDALRVYRTQLAEDEDYLMSFTQDNEFYY